MSDLPEVYHALAGRFGEEVQALDGLTLDDVHDFVRAHVTRLLSENPGLLMSILYRIDVAEPDVQNTLKRGRHEEIPSLLTDLIIERQLQKVRTRRRYRNESEH